MRIVIVDDEPLARARLVHLCQEHAGIEVVAQAGSGADAIEAIRTYRPDVVLLDISMPGLNGIDAARQIRKATPNTRLIFLTMHSDRDYVVEAFRAGASGYLLKWSVISMRRSIVCLRNASSSSCSSRREI